MVAKHAGRVTTQGEVLADNFRRVGRPVVKVSCKANKFHRLLDVVRTLLALRKRISIQCLSIYGGPSFVLEDVASSLGKRLGQRIVLHLHGGALPQFFARYPKWSRRVLRRGDAIVTPSAFLAREVGRLGFAAEIIPNVIELRDYTYRHRRKIEARLFWMRSFHKVWNPLMALRVLRDLRTTHPDTTLVMGGEDKGELRELKDVAAAWGLSAHVRFAGFLDRESKRHEGNLADVFINTNSVDNTPVAVIEAWAMGLPVVSTNVGGIPDLVTERQTALMVGPDDDKGMAKAIRELIDNPSLAGHLSFSGRQAAESCSWTRIRPRWERLLDNPAVAGTGPVSSL
jgi:glycosyltransferase involved in cell wall biosynthesis